MLFACVTLAEHQEDAVLQVTKVLMHRTHPDDTVFEDEDREMFVDLSYDRWVDMGRPDMLTMTIEPGDHLNVG